MQGRVAATTAKVLTDLRKYGVRDSNYRNGTHKIACPPKHRYFVVRTSGCDRVNASRTTLLNCVQLRTATIRNGDEWATGSDLHASPNGDNTCA